MSWKTSRGKSSSTNAVSTTDPFDPFAIKDDGIINDESFSSPSLDASFESFGSFDSDAFNFSAKSASSYPFSSGGGIPKKALGSLDAPDMGSNIFPAAADMSNSSQLPPSPRDVNTMNGNTNKNNGGANNIAVANHNHTPIVAPATMARGQKTSRVGRRRRRKKKRGQSIDRASSVSLQSIAEETDTDDCDFESDYLSDDGSTAAEHQVEQLPLPEVLVHLSLHEEMSCKAQMGKVYECNVVGTINVAVQSVQDEESGTLIEREMDTPFLLNITDSSHQIKSIEENDDLVTDFTKDINAQSNQRVHHVLIPQHQDDVFLNVANYETNMKLPSPPVRVQTKVQVASKFCRVGINIKADKMNESNLTDLSILTAVPDAVNGDTVKMSRRGGIWDSLERLLVWNAKELKIGAKLGLQARFEMILKNDGDDNVVIDKSAICFTALLRCSSLQGQMSRLYIDLLEADGDESIFI